MFTDEMGRCYCAAHRLEKCNACMYNFVEMNRMTEAEHVASRAAAPPAPPTSGGGGGGGGGGDDFSVGDVIIMNNLQSAAARKLNGTSAVVTSSAPNGKGRWEVNIGSAGKRHMLKPSNMRQLTAAERKSFVSPALLPDWDETMNVSSAFLDAMNFTEKIKSTLGVKQSAEFGNRESWVLIANYIDSANGVAHDDRLFRGSSPLEYMLHEEVRIMYQCTDESRGCIVDIIGVKSRVAEDGVKEPVILLYYCEITQAQLLEPGFAQRVVVATSPISRGSFAARLTVEPEEHALLMRMLRKNEQLLDPTFRSFESQRRSVSDGWRTTFVTPTTLESKSNTAKKSRGAGTQCAGPGCTNPGKHICKRCKHVRYCSAVCQKSHWKAGHKKECKAAKRPFVEYDVTFVQPAQRGMFHMNVSHQMSVRAQSRAASRPQPITSEHKAAIGVKALAARAKLGGDFIVKVQCARAGGVSTPLMTYDRKRAIHILLAHDGALPASTSELHRSDATLRQLIQQKGEVGGQKAYCTASVGRESKYLRIYVDKLEAPKAW